jgi:hypothetical protein
VTTLAALLIAAAATTAAGTGEERGVQLASAQVRAAIVRPAIVRQASGLEQGDEAPVPQISRRGRTILIEFE